MREVIKIDAAGEPYVAAFQHREIKEHRPTVAAAANRIRRGYAGMLRVLETAVRKGGKLLNLGHMLCKTLEERLGLV